MVKPSENMMVKRKQHNDFLFLWNEVMLAGPIIRGLDTGGVFDRMTCTEAQALADIFAAAGDQATHDFIIAEHADGDEPDDDHYKEETSE